MMKRFFVSLIHSKYSDIAGLSYHNFICLFFEIAATHIYVFVCSMYMLHQHESVVGVRFTYYYLFGWTPVHCVCVCVWDCGLCSMLVLWLVTISVWLSAFSVLSFAWFHFFWFYHSHLCTEVNYDVHQRQDSKKVYQDLHLICVTTTATTTTIAITKCTYTVWRSDSKHFVNCPFSQFCIQSVGFFIALVGRTVRKLEVFAHDYLFEWRLYVCECPYMCLIYWKNFSILITFNQNI